jgi:hypothetical protein
MVPHGGSDDSRLLLLLATNPFPGVVPDAKSPFVTDLIAGTASTIATNPTDITVGAHASGCGDALLH